MDTMQTIILTSIVNIIITGLVGGVVIYTIQKKIDATIQKSIFEHQTRFTVNHAKTTETLETLYKKYLVFADALKKWTYGAHILSRISHRKTGQEINRDDYLHKKRNVRGTLNDFWNYFEANRIFLSREQIYELWDIYHEASGACQIIEIALDPDEQPLSVEAIRNLSAKIDKFFDIVHRQIERLEMLYKSIADTDAP